MGRPVGQGGNMRKVLAFALAFALAAALAVAGVVRGQAPPPTAPTLEVRPFAGAYVPTGPQRDVLGDAFLAGASLAVEMRPNLAAVGTFAWVPGDDQQLGGYNRVNVLFYDCGVELNRSHEIEPPWFFKP